MHHSLFCKSCLTTNSLTQNSSGPMKKELDLLNPQLLLYRIKTAELSVIAKTVVDYIYRVASMYTWDGSAALAVAIIEFMYLPHIDAFIKRGRLAYDAHWFGHAVISIVAPHLEMKFREIHQVEYIKLDEDSSAIHVYLGGIVSCEILVAIP